MGFRGIIRDFIDLYVGAMLLFGVSHPLSVEQQIIYGFLLVSFSSWFLAERTGLLPH